MLPVMTNKYNLKHNKFVQADFIGTNIESASLRPIKQNSNTQVLLIHQQIMEMAGSN